MKHTPKHLENPPKGKKSILFDLLYYPALAMLVLAVFLFRGSGDGPPARICGFSAMRVLTSSMGEDIPQGSLIITRQVDPTELQIGDDITYLAGEEVTITHRIVDIAEENGELTFTTQGTQNQSPDALPVPPDNIVGKVVFHSLVLGVIFTFLHAHWPWLAVLMVLILALAKAVQVFFREGKPNPEPEGSETNE